MTKQTRILPPGVDSLGEDAVFGTMWIKVGTLKLIRTSNASYNVLCQFWGEATPARLSTRFDTSNNEQQRTQKYDVLIAQFQIKCPVTFFGEYLQEMKNNLRLEVEEVGKVAFDISKFLKKTYRPFLCSINIDSRQAFDHFKGFFEVIGKGNRKAGSLQIQMGCDFDPQVALKQLGEQAIQQIRRSQMMKCPAEKLQVKQCCGHCECVCPKPPRKLPVSKNEVKNDDPRVPHSLDTKPREQNSYDAQRYENKKLQKKIITIQKPRFDEKPQEKKIQDVQQFPHVPQILTYSNLRLNYDDPELKQQINKTPADKMIEQKQRPKSPTKDVQKDNQEQFKPVINMNIGQSVEDVHYQIKAKPQISKEDLLKQFYGAENSPFKSNYEPIHQKKSQQNFFDEKQYEKQKLSRVINLNKQLDNIRAPPLLPSDYDGGERSYFNDTNFRKYGKRTQTKSNLMLSLFIQINRNGVILPSKQAFTIAYRPYGQKERLTLGPSFTDVIHILSNVGESEVKKMNKTPFIIEFWSAVTNKFIGLIKINLHKIKEGFILQDRLNQMAIKTNILPTTIERGDLKIQDLSDKEVGTCSLYAAIGTSNQLNLYLNQKQSIVPSNASKNISVVNPAIVKVEDPQKQPGVAPIKKQQVNVDHKSILTSYETFLQHIYRNNNKVYEELNQLMSDRSISLEQFAQLGKIIGLQTVTNIFELHRKINSEDNESNIDFHTVAHSFDDYVEIVQTAKQDFATCAKVVRNLYADPVSILGKLREHAPMQVVNKKKGQQVMQKYCNYHQPVSDFFSKLNQYISIDLLSSVLTPNRVVELTDLSQLSKQYVTDLILDRVRAQLKAQGINLEQINNQTQQNKKLSVFVLYRLLKGKISLWAIMHLGHHFGKDKKQTDWWDSIDIAQFIQGIKPKNINTHNQLVPQKNPQKANNQPSESQILNNNSQSMHLANQSNNENPQMKTDIEGIHKPIPMEPVIPAQKLLPSQIVEPTQKYHKHLFSIQPTELILDQPIRGNVCTVIYEFPFEQEQVKSKSFQTTIDKHNYSLKMYGTHGFTIAEPVQNYIADNAVKFIIKIDNKIQYEGQLPSDELLIKANTDQDKVIPLFGERAQGIAGKIKLNINYEAAPASENILGKETTYQLFLPKSGYVNYSIACQLQPSKLRSQLNIKQQFYVALVLDIFYNSSVLRNQFPPISSKLYSGENELIQLGGSLKLSLSAVVLQYLKSSKAKLSLNVIYYSKQSSNFQRKQLPFAVIELPLVSIIKAEGIKGNYAFKNKLGMFVTLADCNLKYEKDQNNKLALHRDDREKQRGAYWIILNFLEFINFQDRKFTWIKMEFVLKGRKYATEKLQLQQYSVNFLQNAGIMIKFTQEQFVDTKMIPVTILTNTSQKLAIDINLKTLSKELLNKRVAINNQNYMVVNQSSRATKMRIALKTYCFRGGPLLANFVNALHQHLDVEVFDEMEFPQQIDNYDEMLNIFKNKLKISQKGLQQAMSELDLIKGKQKLNFQFFTNRTYYKLDFTPILAENQTDIGYICQELPTQANKQQIMNYLSDNKIKLQNFRQEFLDRFAFKQLNRSRADKNVQFLGIQNQIDLISFIRKIKILDSSNHQESSYMPNESYDEKMIELTILEGTAFNQLYNGIKPNSLIRIPDIGMQTQVSHRNLNPYFNEAMQIDLDQDNLMLLKNMKIEVYHCTADDDDAENILIGEGFLKLTGQDLKNNTSKVIKVVLTSKMSTKMKATLNVKFAVSSVKRAKRRDQSSMNPIEDSVDVNRFGEIMHDIKQEMADKNRLFQSSDEDEQ